MSNYFNNPRLESAELRKLIPVFMDEIEKDVMSLELALNLADYQTCLELLHKIRGTSMSFGISKLADKTKACKESLEKNKYDVASIDLKGIKEIIDELHLEIKVME